MADFVPCDRLLQKAYFDTGYALPRDEVRPSRCSQMLSEKYYYRHHYVTWNMWNDGDTSCNYFEATYFVQRPTNSRSGHSSVKFNVQTRILDLVTSISHSAQQHPYRVSKLHWKARMLHVKRRNLKTKEAYWLGIQKLNKDVGLRWKHGAFYTV